MTGKQKRQLTMFYLFANADGKCSEEEENRLGSIAESFDTTPEELREIKDEVSRICGVGPDDSACSSKNGDESRTYNGDSLTKSIDSIFGEMFSECNSNSATCSDDYPLWEPYTYTDVDINWEVRKKPPVVEESLDITSRIIAALDSYENKGTYLLSYWTSNLYGEDRLFTILTMISLGYADTEYSENEKRIVKHLVEKWEIDRAIVSVMIDTAETMLALEAKKTWAKSSTMSYNEVNRIIADADADIKRLYHTVEVTISEADIK